jgi:hypothetical protein
MDAMTLRLRRIAPLAIAALLGILAAAPARADHGRAVIDETISSYFRVAERHWGAAPAPCVGVHGEQVLVHAALFDDPDPLIIGRAELPGCRIWLDRDWWPAPPSRRRCLEIVHEWGHLLGHAHAERGLMSPDARGVVPGCNAFRPARPHPVRAGAARRVRRLIMVVRRFR